MQCRKKKITKEGRGYEDKEPAASSPHVAGGLEPRAVGPGHSVSVESFDKAQLNRYLHGIWLISQMRAEKAKWGPKSIFGWLWARKELAVAERGIIPTKIDTGSRGARIAS